MVVLGAGFAGLAAAQGLAGLGVDVLLLDRHNYHLFTPLLYQVASALLDPSQIAHPVRATVRRRRSLRVRVATVRRVDLDHRLVETDRGPVAYDHLVVATGSTTDDFGVAGVDAHAQPLKELPDALALRNHLLSQVESAQWETDATRRRTRLTVAVVGGGPTGIEYAGALAELLRLVLAREFGHLDQREMRVLLLEAGDHLLGAFAPPLQRYAVDQLRRRGVEVRLGTRVTAVEGGRVRLHDGSEIEAGTVVWVAGVRVSPLPGLTGAGDAAGARGAVPVTATLQLPGRPEVLVIGDGAAVVQDGRPLPMIAPVAIQEGRHATRVIAAQLRGEEPPAFRYTDKGIMATIGRHDAVVEVGRWRLRGFPAWVTWLLLHLMLIISFRNRLLVLINWAVNYLFYDRPVRLIVRAGPDRDREAVEGPGPRG